MVATGTYRIYHPTICCRSGIRRRPRHEVLRSLLSSLRSAASHSVRYVTRIIAPTPSSGVVWLQKSGDESLDDFAQQCRYLLKRFVGIDTVCHHARYRRHFRDPASVFFAFKLDANIAHTQSLARIRNRAKWQAAERLWLESRFSSERLHFWATALRDRRRGRNRASWRCFQGDYKMCASWFALADRSDTLCR